MNTVFTCPECNSKWERNSHYMGILQSHSVVSIFSGNPEVADFCGKCGYRAYVQEEEEVKRGSSKMGMLISFEGIDGSGKTTMVKMVSDWLREQGYAVTNIREPGGTSVSEKIRSILIDPDNEISDTSEVLLFMAARAQVTEKIVKPALSRGDIVVADRYIDSSVAYQGHARGLGYERVEELNRIATDNTIPSVTFYLLIPTEVAKERMGDVGLDRVERLGVGFQKKVAKGYDKICLLNPKRFVKIDSNRQIEEIFAEITAEITERLRGYTYTNSLRKVEE